MILMKNNFEVVLPEPTPKQAEFIYSNAKRKVIRAGRRGGKTVGVGIAAVEAFLNGKRVLYAAPTSEQIGRFWTTVNNSLYELISNGVFKKNESEHFIERTRTENRIKAKTAWNADSLRGDYADVLILDEFQLMNEDAWGLVGAPMMLDTDGDAIFIYTPPSLRSRSVSKANDTQHAAKLYKRAQSLQKLNPERWATFSFTSMDNPYISQSALEEISHDMSSIAYRMEIMAEDIEDAPGALWTRAIIEDSRIFDAPANYDKVVVAIDPSASSDGDEAGVITAGKVGQHGFVIEDNSVQGSPSTWAIAAINAYKRHKANYIVAEKNNGGEMIKNVLEQVDRSIKVTLVHASRGKATRAEPISAAYEKGRVHHIGYFPKLEDECCLWIPDGRGKSPNRMDALVWAFTELKLAGGVDWLKIVNT
jgi:phage terminase large subunit-like protein